MSNNESNYIGNGTTIGKFILITFAGWVISLAASKGLDLGVDAQTLAQILGVIFGLAYSYLDAKYPNTLKWFNNAVNPVIENEEIINDIDPTSEYEVGEEQ